MNANADLVINELAVQIANLSKEKAIYAALTTQLRQENENLKKRIEELEKQNEEKKAKPEK
jgi:regulator of replication initiation timing